CFSVAGSATGPGTPAPEVSGQSVTPAPEGAPAPLQPADSPATAAPADRAPAPVPVEISPAVAVRPELPRTGADVLPLTRAGLLLVLLGGAVLAARAALARRAGLHPPTI
ncbi:MAG TPA: hypothetical protein VHL53_00450, partial [Acidimicrobiia bacterium]|nr:hypothetical protein [Acidimicrobiia bacterium]